ncbi:MAG: pantoate--beta-alanine ligase [Phascolarctobacterium sp.]|nr:MAG: pantoate--beta-alanine ligase [Phascolarctobacterium sp.]
MKLCKTVAELREEIALAKAAGKTIGLVPTMGALHEGHASLIKAAAMENELVVVSVFVNPTQFGPGEDLDAYPRTLDADCKLAEGMGADIVFAPTPAEMYPSEDMTWVEVTGDITKVLCGRTRPIHFRGVTTVVSKLFNLAQPDHAYFGQKDAQQAEVIKRMVKDLFFNVKLRIMPIVREADGLAKSSRNTYLTKAQRAEAVVLSSSLETAKTLFDAGERDSKKLVDGVKRLIGDEPAAEIDYVEMYALPGLKPVPDVLTKGQYLLAVAVKFGTTRLIDNVILEVK